MFRLKFDAERKDSADSFSVMKERNSWKLIHFLCEKKHSIHLGINLTWRTDGLTFVWLLLCGKQETGCFITLQKKWESIKTDILGATEAVLVIRPPPPHLSGDRGIPARNTWPRKNVSRKQLQNRVVCCTNWRDNWAVPPYTYTIIIRGKKGRNKLSSH